jgi:hypothetical protein
MTLTTEQKERFWTAVPFPHLVLEDFMGDAYIKNVQHKIKYWGPPVYAQRNTFNENSRLGELLQPVVDKLTSKGTLEALYALTGVWPIPLTALSDTQYIYQHTRNSVLEAHVDHSQLYNRGKVTSPHVHFLNCIYYATENNTLGGHTQLFGPTGWGVHRNRVSCVPDRLLVFLHTSRSFHGMSKFYGSTRTSVYMDYYAANITAMETSPVIPRLFWRHRTTFVPRSLLTLPKYGPWYLEWMLKRRLWV